MDDFTEKGFKIQTTSCNFNYNKSFFKNDIDKSDIRLNNIQKEILYCKSDVDYIRAFIDYIKETVIKKCQKLKSVKIILSTFDKNNLIHKIIIVVTNMVKDLLKIKEKINHYKSIFVVVEYEDKAIFVGDLNFTGLC
uniref:Uncharacterized protein n=1 Tax=viral metagenome TaxID=1070528 RepID=A0A6C0BEB8_9ZZZZ